MNSIKIRSGKDRPPLNFKKNKNSKKYKIAELSGWSKPNSLFKGILLISITFFIFYFLFQKIDLRQVNQDLQQISFKTWIIASILSFSFLIFSAIRWHIIIKVMGNYVSIKRCILIILGIWPLSSISPSKSGDLLKAFSLRKEISAMKVAGTVITERILDLVMLSLFAFVGGLLLDQKLITFISGGIILLIISIVCLSRFSHMFSINESVKDKLSDLLHSLTLLTQKPFLLCLILLLTALNWFASIIQTKILFDSVGASVTLGFTTTALPIAIFAGLLPITFGGMGTRDSAIVLLFSSFSTTSQSLSVAILYSFFGYWLLAVFGIPFIRKALN